MITRILLGLDGTPCSVAAARCALDLALAHGAVVDARVLVDAPWITRPMAVGIGGMAHKVAAETAELRRAHAEGARVEEGVRAAARERGVAVEVTVAEGEPVAVLSEAALAADLIVLGHDVSFWGDEDDALGPAVQGVLERNPRPLVVVPRDPPAGERVLVAYDGSVPAGRALHMAALLGVARGRGVVVLSADEDGAVAGRRAETAARLLRAHGAAVEDVLGLGSSAAPAELITTQMRAVHAGMAVIGAYGHTGLREMLFGSCTRTMLRTCPGVLFIDH